MKTLKYVFMILLFLPFSIVFADIIHVPADTATIQDAIDMANPGDTVLVAEGLYIENVEINNKLIVLASHFLLDEDTSHISRTIIDGSQPAVTDSASTVVIRFNSESCPVLCGFTITGGYGTVVSEGARVAGGIAVIASHAIIEHNIIAENIIDYDTVPDDYPGGGGAGVYILPLFYNNISVIIRDNIIKRNLVEGNQTAGAGLQIQALGGSSNFNFLVEKNTIEDNTVINLDDWKAFGGGIEVELSIPTSGEQIIRNNIIRRNSAECEHSFGGGIYVVFLENNADGSVDSEPGPFIYNNIIADNHADYSGGGVAFFRIYKPTIYSQPEPLTSPGKYTPKPAFINNTIVNNTAADGAGIFTMNHIPFFMNNILWNNSNPDAEWGEIFIGNVDRWIEDNSYGGIEISYSDIQGDTIWKGEGNINSDPMFEKDSYTLSSSSYCIGGGIASIEINGISYECPPTDYEGNPRPRPQDSNPDMGAIESDLADDIERNKSILPQEFALYQNYPNPFNPKTIISYSVGANGHSPLQYVDLSIYNILGQEVATLVNKKQPAGNYSVEWDASKVSSGVYYYRLEADGYSDVKKMVVIR